MKKFTFRFFVSFRALGTLSWPPERLTDSQVTQDKILSEDPPSEEAGETIDPNE